MGGTGDGTIQVGKVVSGKFFLEFFSGYMGGCRVHPIEFLIRNVHIFMKIGGDHGLFGWLSEVSQMTGRRTIIEGLVLANLFLRNS